jgi:DNA adenine methylase
MLKKARILQQDFETPLGDAQPGDLVYCDPTYTVSHDNNGFLKYNERVFSWRDQIRLAVAAEDARSRGVTVLVSNAHHDDLIDLYPGAEQFVFSRHNLLCPSPDHRGLATEFLFVFDPAGRRPA